MLIHTFSPQVKQNYKKYKKKTGKKNKIGIKGFAKAKYVSVAQLDRVSASDAEGCGFDPRRIRHKKASHMNCPPKVGG